METTSVETDLVSYQLGITNKNINGNNISWDWSGVMPTWHYQQEHQWKRDQWRLIWCHTNFALPTRTSVETTSVETDLVSYWLGITNLMLYQLGILIIVLVLSQLVVTDLVLHSVLNYVILSWYYTNWVLYAWHYTDLVLTWCYTNLVLYWLGVILQYPLRIRVQFKLLFCCHAGVIKRHRLLVLEPEGQTKYMSQCWTGTEVSPRWTVMYMSPNWMVRNVSPDRTVMYMSPNWMVRNTSPGWTVMYMSPNWMVRNMSPS